MLPATEPPPVVVAATPIPTSSPASIPPVGEPTAVPASSSDAVTREQVAATQSVPPLLFPAPVDSGAVQGWRLSLPQIGVDAQVVSVGLEQDGAMGAPTGPDDVGWYERSALPGQTGNVLMDGHVDWTDRATGKPRTAVFWDLARLDTGSRVIITRDGREYTYAVTEKHSYQWDDVIGASVLQPTSDARVTLITCGGVFDRATHNYSRREVVIALLVSPTSTRPTAALSTSDGKGTSYRQNAEVMRRL